jgi:ribosomal protein S18 acetylase RimI-like enzyme
MTTIRPARAEDEAAVVALWQACGLVAPHNDPAADFRFALAGPACAILLARRDARIVGSVMVGHDGHRGWLYYVAAAPDVRGTGIGRAMVEAGEQWLRARGVPKVQLMVRPSNPAVVPFYERLGYEDMPRVLMSKWLRD